MQPTLEQLRARYGARYKWWVLLTVMIGTMTSILSSTIVNVAIPDLSQHFHLGQERAQWVSSGFMLAMTISMLSTPWLLLRFGLRRTYAGAILLLLGHARQFDWKGLLLVGLSLIGFIAYPLRAEQPLMQMQLFDFRQFSMGALVAFIYGMGLVGIVLEWRLAAYAADAGGLANAGSASPVTLCGAQ